MFGHFFTFKDGDTITTEIAIPIGHDGEWTAYKNDGDGWPIVTVNSKPCLLIPLRRLMELASAATSGSELVALTDGPYAAGGPLFGHTGDEPDPATTITHLHGKKIAAS